MLINVEATCICGSLLTSSGERVPEEGKLKGIKRWINTLFFGGGLLIKIKFKKKVQM